MFFEYLKFPKCVTINQLTKTTYLIHDYGAKLVVLVSYTWGKDVEAFEKFDNDKNMAKTVLEYLHNSIKRSPQNGVEKYFEWAEVYNVCVKRCK